MWHQFWQLLLDVRVRYALAWVLLVVALTARLYTAWTNFASPERPDGNDGHTSIDFAGQWLMGRLLVTGHGHELYSRATHTAVANDAFPHANENPTQEKHDVQRIVDCYPGPVADPVSGPLYPPIHAFVMAPLGTIADPRVAYRVWQVVLFGAIALTGLGIRTLTRRRWWWVVATALVLLAPGSRGCTDLGQNGVLTLALLVWGWAALMHGRPVWCGLLWGLLAFKPVWAVSFVGALLLLQQWRAAAAMIGTGLACIVLTVPFTGVQAWFDWLHVGQNATATYCVDRNWIFLSRDLFGIPRRIWLTFEDGRAVADRPLVGVIGWALWLSIAATTVVVVYRAARRWPCAAVHRGPYPAFVFGAAWLCTYRFMYYDAVVGVLVVAVLVAMPGRYGQRGRWWPWLFVALPFVVENITVPMHLDISASFMGLRGTVNVDGKTVTTAPAIYLSSADEYPWDTVAIFLLWLVSGWLLWRERARTSPTL